MSTNANAGVLSYMLRVYPLPDVAQFVIADNVALHAAFAQNPYAINEDVWLRIYKTAKADVANDLASNVPTAKCVDEVIASKERRAGVLTSVVSQWVPTKDQRSSVANLRLIPRVAGVILSKWGKFDDVAGAHLAEQCDAVTALTWLDETPTLAAAERRSVFKTALSKVTDTNMAVLCDALIMSLCYQYPELVNVVLQSGSWSLASFRPLNETQQHAYVERLRGAILRGRNLSMVTKSLAAFCARSEHDIKLRMSAWNIAATSSRDALDVLCRNWVLPVRESAPTGDLGSLGFAEIDSMLQTDDFGRYGGIWIDLAIEHWDVMDKSQHRILIERLGRISNDFSTTRAYSMIARNLKSHFNHSSWGARTLGEADIRMSSREHAAEVALARFGNNLSVERIREQPSRFGGAKSNSAHAISNLRFGGYVVGNSGGYVVGNAAFAALTEIFGDSKQAWSLAFAMIDDIGNQTTVGDFANSVVALCK